MKITIEVPKEFEKDFTDDKFNDFFERISADLEYVVCGRYEKETLKMMHHAFYDAQNVPDTNAGDMISRKKLIEKLECIRWKMASDTTPMQALEVKFGNEMLEMVLQVINNQPPVQQIVRTPEEITYYKCCKACGLNARCERENQRDCDEFLEMIEWLTGKQV